MIKVNTLNNRIILRKKGFTLVELMVVLAIIATMTFIAVPNFTSVKASVNQKVDDQSCEAIRKVISTFIADDTIDVSKTKTLTYDANIYRNKVIGINGDNLSTNSKKILNDALNDVKPPRVDNAMVYNINIDDDGTVIVTTDEKITGKAVGASSSSEK